MHVHIGYKPRARVRCYLDVGMGQQASKSAEQSEITRELTGLRNGEDRYHRDVATLYGTKTINVKKIVKRQHSISFEVFYSTLLERTQAFVLDIMWLPPDVPRRVVELDWNTPTELLHEEIQLVPVIAMIPDEKQNSVHVVFNHEVVGGGDFLHWAVYCIGGDKGYSRSLLPIPSLLTQLGTLCVAACRLASNPLVTHKPISNRSSMDYSNPRVYQIRWDL